MPADSGQPATDGELERDKPLRRQAPSFLSKLSLASHVYGLKGVLVPIFWLRDWAEYLYPPPQAPNIVKTHECRPNLPIR